MKESALLAEGVTHQLFSAAMKMTQRDDRTIDDRATNQDSGAISLEHVLWFVAAGVSVAVIAAILWGKIRTEANRSINTPIAP